MGETGRKGRGDGVRDGFRFLFGFAIRDPQAGVAGSHKFPVAPAVALEGEVGCVEVTAVGLDDEPGFGPEEVNLDAAVRDLDRGIEERGGMVAPQDQRQHLRLRGLLSLPFFARGAAWRHVSTSFRSDGIPRRPGSIDASIAGTSSSFRCAARSKQLRSVRSPTVPARSTSVRAGLVHGMPSTVPVSSSRGGRTRWKRMPSIARPCSCGGITSITTGPSFTSPSKAAALRCEMTAPLPQARAAACRRPRGLMLWRPNA